MRGVSYFNNAVRGKSGKKLKQWTPFMTTENPNTPRLVKLRRINNAYRQMHI